MISTIDQLEFPYADAPPPGVVTEVAPGLLWARLPLPFRLNHVNVWLLEEDDGWTVIDTGCATPAIHAAWAQLLAGPMRGKPVVRVIATHGHVDHIGLTGWMVERFDAEFMGTFGEWMWARVSHTRDFSGANETHHRFLVSHGFEEAVAERMVKGRQRFIDLSSALPGAIREIRDGEIVRLGGRDWIVMVTRGHAFEHASFYCPADGILIAGDHLLPKISPVIAVYEMAPKADPLADYLASFPQFDGIPAGTLVLPSHGMPYRGIHQRVAGLRQHHDRRLDATAGFLRRPSNGLDLSKAMFPHIEGPENIGFALGETLAHVNYLVHQGIVDEARDAAGRNVYVTRG
ncbi:MAG: MBL fold metallo-hydrolase [Mesorhizobium sp.]|nr:MBL fold metallo-hydrolase [Mesorhizobium sp.]